MEVVATGMSGLLGHYLKKEFSGDKIFSIGRSEGNTLLCDLTKEIPVLPDGFKPILAIHAAGTEEESENALAVNLEGTRNFLVSLSDHIPESMVYISSYKVYPPDAGKDITEDHNTWASGKAGQSKALAENEIKDWCEHRGVRLTIIRPATMFGTGMKGWAHKMFNDVVKGQYIHIRGNEASISCVTAYDVAKGVNLLWRQGGIYNFADGGQYTYIDLANAMSENAGAMKRMTHLPSKWACCIYRFGKWIPFISNALNPEMLESREHTLTLSNNKALEAGMKFHSVVEVLSRQDSDYPYETV